MLKTLTKLLARGKKRTAANEMSFLEHLEELRMTIWSCVAAFSIAAIASIIFYKYIFAALRWPLERALDAETANAHLNALTAMRFMDVFSILLYIALLGGIALSCPVILYRIGKFIAPALSDTERKKIVPACAAATILFFIGGAMAFFWLAPLSINFMYYFSGEMGLQVNWLASDYYSFIVILVLFVGLMFEFPLGIIALVYLEIVPAKSLMAKWRWSVAIILIACAIISPIGDPIALLGLTAVLFLLYMASVLAGDFFLKRKLAARAREEKLFEAEFSTKPRPVAHEETKISAKIPAAPLPAFPHEETPQEKAPTVEDADGDLRFIDE